MEEKILIKSEKYNLKKLLAIFVVIGIVLSIISFAIYYSDRHTFYKEDYGYSDHQVKRECIDKVYRPEFDEKYEALMNSYGYKSYYSGWTESENYISEEDYLVKIIESGEFVPEYSCGVCRFPSIFLRIMNDGHWPYFAIPFAAFSLIGILLYFGLNSYSLTVSDKRVSGEVLFGKKVDLPIDSVSATSIISIFKGVGISTSSGRISFLAIKNSAEIYEVINNLLIERQSKKEQSVPQTVEVKPDEADQLKKYKELLDTGVITQEEFDAKKKQLLGL